MSGKHGEDLSAWGHNIPTSLVLKVKKWWNNEAPLEKRIELCRKVRLGKPKEAAGKKFERFSIKTQTSIIRRVRGSLE